MIFNTWVFAVFGIVTVAVYWTVPQRLKPYYLILAGAVFYLYAVPVYLALVASLGGITYAIARVMLHNGGSRRNRRAWLALGVVLITGVLVYFKYTRFLALTVDQIAGQNIVPVPTIIVPLAISFFTFEFVHVLVDVYYGRIKRIDPLEFSVFTLFFPTLVAGPIKRYQTFAPQVRAIVPPAPSDVSLNVYRVIMGLAKKYIVADSMTLLTQPILTPGPPFGPADYWIGMFAYAAKIYFDFTGYSDIAIGVAGLLGLKVPENFDRPYWSENIAQFWRRWHMSLSSWIRDYIFIPLGGSRGGRAATALNLFVAMVLAGLWHGAAWTFALWGLWHGVGLAVHRAWSLAVVPRSAVLRNSGRVVHAASVVATFLFVCFGWVLFATPTAANAGAVYWHLLTGK